jgi:hypothetical protein
LAYIKHAQCLIKLLFTKLPLNKIKLLKTTLASTPYNILKTKYPC